MQKSSSKKNTFIIASALAAVLLLCLGGYFVFLKQSNGSLQDADNTQSAGTSLFIKANNSSLAAPDVSAKSAILIEACSGEVIFSKNPDVRLPMASTTKIMTALVAIENCDISKMVSVSPLAVGVEGSSVYLYPEEKLTLEDLI